MSQSGFNMSPFRHRAVIARAVSLYRHRVGGKLMDSMGISAAGAGMGFISQIFLARLAGPLDFGTYMYVMGILNLAFVWCVVDLGAAALRFAPGYAEAGRADRLRGMFVLGRRTIAGTLSVAAILLVTPLAAPLGAKLGGYNLVLLWILLLFGSMQRLDSVFLVALGGIRVGVGLQQLLRPALVIIIAAAVVLGTRLEEQVNVPLLANTAATMLSASLAMIVLRRRISAVGVDATPSFETSTWFRYSGAFFISSVLQTLISTQADTVIVGTIVTTTAAGTYAVASQIAGVVAIAPMAIVNVVRVRYAAAYDSGDPGRLRRATADMVLLVAGAAMVSALGVLSLSPALLWLFGAAGQGAGPAAMILIGASVISYSFSVAPTMILATEGFRTHLVVANVAFALAAVGTSIVLTRSFGMLGAAVATAGVAVLRGAVLQIMQTALTPGRVSVASLRTAFASLVQVVRG